MFSKLTQALLTVSFPGTPPVMGITRYPPGMGGQGPLPTGVARPITQTMPPPPPPPQGMIPSTTSPPRMMQQQTSMGRLYSV